MLNPETKVPFLLDVYKSSYELAVALCHTRVLLELMPFAVQLKYVCDPIAAATFDGPETI